MPTAQEKAEFSARLKYVLEKSSHPVKAADLARLFNLRHRSVSYIGISVQTAYKWLNSRAIPTAEQIKVLAKWLNVSEHWLFYGASPAETGRYRRDIPFIRDAF